MSIATFSNDLKIFNGDETFSLSASAPINKISDTYGRITWSGDAKWIAVTPVKRSGDPLSIFKYKEHQLNPVKYVTITNIKSASFFNWTNRSIAVGAETGSIYVWDLKEKKISVNIDTANRHSVDLICVNSDDTSLASGSLNSNKICVHSLKTNKVVNTLTIPNSVHASSLSFCMCKKSYLAASSYESTICVWDITRSDTIFKSLNSHCGACTGVSFSPINYSVVASVGLTKTLKMYDLREKTSILDVNIGEPMHCVDMISNGDKIAVGTSSGSVILYDLRANKVCHTIKAHDTPVLSVKMQVMKKPKSYQEIDMNTPDVVEVQSKTLDLSVMDIFSPIYKVSESRSASSSKIVSFHSTPRVIVSDSDSVLEYNDSFLCKMLSPKNGNVLISTPIEQNVSVPKKNDFNNSSSKLETLEEEPPAFNNDVSEVETRGMGDGPHVLQPPSQDYLQSFLSEMKTIHMEQQKSITEISQQIASIKKDIQTMKLEQEAKHQILQDNYEGIMHAIVNDIKQDICAGNWDAKLEHICQRLLINEVRDLVSNKSHKVVNEINK